MIYADNAATTKLDIEAFEAMKPFLLDSYSNPSQPYSFSRESNKAMKQARETIARCIGAYSEEIYFTSGGSESDNWALKLGSGLNGDIITSEIEHHAVLNSCKFLERHGRNVLYATATADGVIDLKFIKEHITDETKLISVMYANNEIGSIQPVKELASIAHAKEVLFHTDAVQAVGHIDINVHDLNVDFLSASAHKFNGPKGIGFLYIKKGTQIASYIDGGNQESGRRAGTENVAAIVAMAVALENNCKRIQENKEYLEELEGIFFDRLNMGNVDYIRNGAANHIPGNINISVAGCEGETLLHRLDLRGICISTGAACDSVNTQISHVIKAIKVPKKYAKGTIRISLGKQNTAQEVEIIAEELAKIVKGVGM